MIALIGAASQLNQKSSSGFPLLKLPLLARNIVFALVEKKDLIRLALTSHQTEHSLQLSDEKIESVQICFSPFEFSTDSCFYSTITVDLKKGRVKLFCTKGGFKFNMENCRAEILAKENNWLRTKISSPFENTLDALRFIYSIFRLAKEATFCIDYKASEVSFQHILTHPEFQHWSQLDYNSESIREEDLDLIMGYAEFSRQISVFAYIPEQYRHKNKFIFQECRYFNARWIQLDELLNLKSAHIIELGQTNFNEEDFKKLVRTWVRSETDMFFWLYIRGKTDMNGVDELLDGFITVEYSDARISVLFTLAKTTSPTRKREILAIRQMGNELLLTAWRTDERVVEDPKEPEKEFKNVYQILQALERKAELEKDAERNRVEIQAVMEELEKLNVRFEDGQAKAEIN